MNILYALSIILQSLFLLGIAMETSDYGADVSFPIHHQDLRDGPLGDRRSCYQEFIQGCRKFYGKSAHLCDDGENARLERNLRQPQSMVVRFLAVDLYGIRLYSEGAILNPHVDRLPLVCSCIVNVAQDVDEPWPLEVYDRQGNAANQTIEPGEMILYESHSLISGRPFPLKGRFYANVFIHFEPTGRKLAGIDNADKDRIHTLHDFFPPYVLPHSP